MTPGGGVRGPRSYGTMWRPKTIGLVGSQIEKEADRRAKRPKLADHPLLDREPSRARPRSRRHA